MERAFANAMAVNVFEISRYIIPSNRDSSKDYMNYTNQGNNPDKPSIYGGSPQRDYFNGDGNKPFKDRYTSGVENPDPLLNESNSFSESYTSLRTGIREIGRAHV